METQESVIYTRYSSTGQNEQLIENVNGKAYQKRVINNLVNYVYVSDDRTIIYFSFNAGETPFVDKAETRRCNK